jgi:Lrp/AsnC family transcriptional regulator, regulator of ectoine-degradation genes
MTAKRSPALDRIDVKILAALQRDGRQSIQKLSASAGLSARACLERVRRQALVDLARLSKPVTVFAEIVLEKQARQGDLEKRIASIEEVVECWEVSGAVDYVARFVCADLAGYQELTNRLIDDPKLGVARIVSHVALRPIRRFTGYPETLLQRKGTES